MNRELQTKKAILALIKKYKNKADYFDIRLGESSGTYININQKHISDASKPKTFGGSVRVLHNGGWGFSTFNDPAEMEKSLSDAIGFAKKVGKSKTTLAPVKPVVDKIVVPPGKKAFQKVDIGKKVETLKKYSDLAWSKGKKLVNVEIYYTDNHKQKFFASSEGAFIEKEEAFVGSLVAVSAKSGTTIERYIDFLVDMDFENFFKKDKTVLNAVAVAQRLAKAQNVKSGIYDVVMQQSLAGVFAHEAFGHLSEADNAYENPQIAGVMKLGTQFGSPILNISDDPTIPNQRGTYKYDDEGVEARETKLLVDGVLVGRMHSRETAGKMGEEVTGHARAESVFVQPIVRMGVTYIKPGKDKFTDMIKSIKNGIYCIKWQGGMTDHERFTFTAGYGRLITNGKLGKIVRNVKLSGNLFDTLKNVDMIGSDLQFEGGTCGKNGQYMPNTTGAPHIKIKGVSVIGV